MGFGEWTVWDENEEKKKKFPGLPWSNPLNMIQQTDPAEYPPNSMGARMAKRMKSMIAEVTNDPIIAGEAFRLAFSTTEDLNVSQLVERAQKIIEISSKPF